MEEKLDLILTTLTEMKQDISTLKQDVAILKDDVSTLKQDVAILKNDSSTLKQNDTIQNNNYHYLTSLVHNLAEKLENLTKQVTIMEKEHSEKLQVLLDQHIDCVRRHVSIACDLVEIDHTFAKHDAIK